jgi:sporulation protein YlmC with PRC-barrel domain
MAITGDEATLASMPLTGVLQTRDGVFQVSHGMEVVGADGTQVGRLKEMRLADILVDRPLKRDVYVPFTAIQGVRGDTIVLTIPAAQVDQMDWPQPPLLPLGPE